MRASIGCALSLFCLFLMVKGESDNNLDDYDFDEDDFDKSLPKANKAVCRSPDKGGNLYEFQLGDGDKFLFKTPGKLSARNVRCMATYKLKDDCMEAEIMCKRFSLANFKSCSGGNYMKISSPDFNEKFCRKEGPKMTIKSNQFSIKLRTGSGRQKGNRVSCMLRCAKGKPTTPAITTPPPTTTTASLGSCDNWVPSDPIASLSGYWTIEECATSATGTLWFLWNSGCYTVSGGELVAEVNEVSTCTETYPNVCLDMVCEDSYAYAGTAAGSPDFCFHNYPGFPYATYFIDTGECRLYQTCDNPIPATTGKTYSAKADFCTFMEGHLTLTTFWA